MMSEDQVIREVYKKEKQIEQLKSEIEELLFENGLEDVDLSEEFLQIAKSETKESC